MNIQKACYFTYFKGPKDIIFYTTGAGTHPDKDGIRAVAVFYPDNGNRTQYGSSIKYSRLIINGFKEDRVLLKNLPTAIQEEISSLFSSDPTTKEPILRVPVKEVKEIYSPQESLKTLILKPPNIPKISIVLERVKASISLLSEYDIPERDIGFYGSLQCNIFPDDLERNFNDIDFLIYGLKYQENIVSIARNHKFAIKYKRIDSKDRVGVRVEKRQLDLSEVHFNYKKGSIFMHLTQIRKEYDENNNPNLKEIKLTSKAKNLVGIVKDSSEALTNPSVYVVQVGKTTIKVINRYYRFTKAAYKGDVVKLRGVFSKDRKYLLITRPMEHYILPIKMAARTLA